MTTPEAGPPSLATAAAVLLGLLETGRGLPPAVAAEVRRAYDELVAVQRSRLMLDAVRADLADIDISKVRGGRTYQRTALWLAEVIDKRGADDGPSTTAKLADQLTKVMQALTKHSGAPEGDAFADWQLDIAEPSMGG